MESSRDSEPKRKAAYADCSQEGGDVLGVARSDAPPALEMQKCVLHEMAVLVEVFVITLLLLSIFAGRDHDAHALSGGLLDDDIAVVALVGQQVLGTKSFNQWRSLRAIRGGTLRNNNSDRHTKRIHGQM